jgi:hypothetical protein
VTLWVLTPWTYIVAMAQFEGSVTATFLVLTMSCGKGGALWRTWGMARSRAPKAVWKPRGLKPLA